MLGRHTVDSCVTSCKYTRLLHASNFIFLNTLLEHFPLLLGELVGEVGWLGSLFFIVTLFVFVSEQTVKSSDLRFSLGHRC